MYVGFNQINQIERFYFFVILQHAFLISDGREVQHETYHFKGNKYQYPLAIISNY